MKSSAADRHFILRALTLARGGLFTADPNPRVGCVLTRDGRVVGEGFHARAGKGMPRLTHCVTRATTHAARRPM